MILSNNRCTNRGSVEFCCCNLVYQSVSLNAVRRARAEVDDCTGAGPGAGAGGFVNLNLKSTLFFTLEVGARLCTLAGLTGFELDLVLASAAAVVEKRLSIVIEMRCDVL
jgi:hypothetical protein